MATENRRTLAELKAAGVKAMRRSPRTAVNNVDDLSVEIMGLSISDSAEDEVCARTIFSVFFFFNLRVFVVWFLVSNMFTFYELYNCGKICKLLFADF